MGTIKETAGPNGSRRDEEEVTRIHKRTLQKTVNYSNNHDGVVTNLELDILEWEVKWALGSITMNKVSGGDRIPAELFKSLKDMLLITCTQYVRKSGKLSSGHRTEKGKFLFQFQRRAMPKNVSTTL